MLVKTNKDLFISQQMRELCCLTEGGWIHWTVNYTDTRSFYKHFILFFGSKTVFVKF